jgi:hypothetical protein
MESADVIIESAVALSQEIHDGPFERYTGHGIWAHWEGDRTYSLEKKKILRIDLDPALERHGCMSERTVGYPGPWTGGCPKQNPWGFPFEWKCPDSPEFPEACPLWAISAKYGPFWQPAFQRPSAFELDLDEL